MATTVSRGPQAANQNPFGVAVEALEFPVARPSFGTKTFHGCGLVVVSPGAQRAIGRIQSWTPQIHSRDGIHLWELHWDTFGVPIDYIPGRLNAPSASVSRTEVWDDEFELALGYPTIWTTLCDQTKPFITDEFWHKGEEEYRIWEYVGCWFGDKNESGLEAEGDTIVRADGTVNFVTRFMIG